MTSVDELTKTFAESLKLSGKDDANTALIEKVDTKGLTELQNAELRQWLTLSSRFPDGLDQLNETLKSRTYLLNDSTSVTVADAIVLSRVLPLVKEWKEDQIIAQRHIVRWVDLVQNSVNVEDKLVVKVDLEAPREFKAKPEKKGGDKKADKKAEGEAKTKAEAKPEEEKKNDRADKKDGVKKEKKKKEKKPQPEKVEVPVTPGMIDLRVGWIEKAVKHPDADSLYVSTIHMGDEEGPRTVCSGLVKYIPIEQMQDRKVVVVANLKPVSMRGIKSTAMVLCASDENTVEFVNPPADSKAGDKIFFETYDTEPEKQLNPKKKIWEQIQPGFTTTDKLEVIYKKEGEPDRKLVNKAGELCLVSSLVNAQVR
ncbi:tRNA-aminoacylation cofactor Arc1p [Trichomonascus vanleenenianus]|uniref:Arc1p n=1 Tax=Trichomonascus vanleenenianus TaxID=2268995 RepID=UPI003EC967D8